MTTTDKEFLDPVADSIDLLISTFPMEQHGDSDTIMRAMLIASDGYSASVVAQTVKSILQARVLDHDPHYLPTASEFAMYLRDIEAGSVFEENVTAASRVTSRDAANIIQLRGGAGADPHGSGAA